MEVRGLNSVGASAPVSRTSPVQAAGPAAPAAPPAAPRDEVEISSVSRMLDDASRIPGVREQRLEQIKAAIEAGTYETPEKLQIALDRMLEQIGGNDG
ncbi:MAG TPA: flagellar biosynthesis anti-sigma factor FlgM [Planctomycetaceae bacterium]|nr:flagellar biosynthesis anti-sigma factor FlgM [Planctomycetaceae bacterium]